MSEWDFTTDAVIIGSGGGALCAAVAGSARQLDVLVVEKTEFVGGSTAMSGGGVWIPNNPLMRAYGVADSEDDALAHLEAVVGDIGLASSPERRRAFVANGSRLVEFLQQRGVPFRYADGYSDYYPDAPGGKEHGRTIEAYPFDAHELGPWETKLRPGMSTGLGLVGFGTELTAISYYNRSARSFAAGVRVLGRTVAGRARARAMVANGGALVGRLLRAALEQGTEIWTESPIKELIVQDGAVVGVVILRRGKALRVAARLGVLLAAGGFSRNSEMRNRYGGGQARSAKWSISNPGDTGEVLEMAMAIGGATDLLDEAFWLPMPCMADGSLPRYPSRQVSAFSRARWRPGSIMVDSTGSRFANEATSYMELGQQMFARDRQVRAIPSWLIFDDAFRRRSLFGTVPGRLPEGWIRDGFIHRAGTADELATECGVDPGGLAETLQRFNAFARTGVDTDFHRGESAYDRFMGDPRHQPNNCLAPISRPPFYAVATYPCDVGTCGGLLTDASGRVLSEAGQAVPGLYATGNVTASLMGRYYLGAGASIGQTCTFGFVAMNDMAARAASANPARSGS